MSVHNAWNMQYLILHVVSSNSVASVADMAPGHLKALEIFVQHFCVLLLGILRYIYCPVRYGIDISVQHFCVLSLFSEALGKQKE